MKDPKDIPTKQGNWPKEPLEVDRRMLKFVNMAWFAWKYDAWHTFPRHEREICFAHYDKDYKYTEDPDKIKFAAKLVWQNFPESYIKEQRSIPPRVDFVLEWLGNACKEDYAYSEGHEDILGMTIRDDTVDLRYNYGRDKQIVGWYRFRVAEGLASDAYIKACRERYVLPEQKIPPIAVPTIQPRRRVGQLTLGDFA